MKPRFPRLLQTTVSAELGEWVADQAKREGRSVAGWLRHRLEQERERMERGRFWDEPPRGDHG